MIGFAGKYYSEDIPENLTFKTTTLTWLKKSSNKEKEQKLRSIIHHNLTSLENLVKKISTWDSNLRFFRIGSDLLPFFDLEEKIYLSENSFIIDKLTNIGNICNSNNIRLTMHPDQFCVLNNSSKKENTLKILNYHGFLGEALNTKDFCINVHGGGKLHSLNNIHDVLNVCSEFVRNSITFENDEFSWDVKDLLSANLPRIVLDVHHFWIYNKEYFCLDKHETLWNSILNSWDKKPKIHFSLPENLLSSDPNEMINESYFVRNKKELRSHSYLPWNKANILYLKDFMNDVDIMFEGKSKNVGAKIINDILGEKI